MEHLHICQDTGGFPSPSNVILTTMCCGTWRQFWRSCASGWVIETAHICLTWFASCLCLNGIFPVQVHEPAIHHPQHGLSRRAKVSTSQSYHSAPCNRCTSSPKLRKGEESRFRFTPMLVWKRYLYYIKKLIVLRNSTYVCIHKGKRGRGCFASSSTWLLVSATPDAK